jgi:hypothetical protein
LLYNGFYAFEMMSQRSLDDVICEICGIVCQVYFGDGNEKNCCSIDAVSSLLKNVLFGMLLCLQSFYTVGNDLYTVGT